MDDQQYCFAPELISPEYFCDKKNVAEFVKSCRSRANSFCEDSKAMSLIEQQAQNSNRRLFSEIAGVERGSFGSNPIEDIVCPTVHRRKVRKTNEYYVKNGKEFNEFIFGDDLSLCMVKSLSGTGNVFKSEHIMFDGKLEQGVTEDCAYYSASYYFNDKITEHVYLKNSRFVKECCLLNYYRYFYDKNGIITKVYNLSYRCCPEGVTSLVKEMPSPQRCSFGGNVYMFKTYEYVFSYDENGLYKSFIKKDYQTKEVVEKEVKNKYNGGEFTSRPSYTNEL